MSSNVFLHLEWLENHLKKVKKNAGNRYTPELNVDLPIAEIFDGLGRTEDFYIVIRRHYGTLRREFRRVSSNYEDKEIKKLYSVFKYEVTCLLRVLETIKEYNTLNIPWKKINKNAQRAEDISWKLSDRLREEKSKHEKEKEAKSQGGYQSSAERFGSDIHYIYEVQKELNYFIKFSTSTGANLSNCPFLLLTGVAGTGKTHLLCDLAEDRIRKRKPLPTVLVFGELFSTSDDPLLQINKQLELEASRSEFLKMLDRAGKCSGARSILIIDALNETRQRFFWKRNLSKVVKEVEKYPNIGLIVSVREGFEEEVLTKKVDKTFVQEKHQGFEFREWEAANKFFKEFSIPLPEVPLLLPEFKQPLFLLLFCAAFGKKNKDLSEKTKIQLKSIKPFKGHVGATHIFEAFIKQAADKIASDFKLSKRKSTNGEYVIWDTVIKKVSAMMVEENDDRVSEEQVFQIVNESYPSVDSVAFIQALERNLLLVKVPRYSIEKGGYEGFDFRFPFQKFSDHLIARYIFKKYEIEVGKSGKSLGTAKAFFSKRRKLGRFLAKSWNRGIIEALSIQCPEYLRGHELVDVAPYLKHLEVAEDAFIGSLVWRRPSAFSTDLKSVRDYINTSVIRTKSGHHNLLNAFLSVASVPDHPFNADFLHKHLSMFSMPDRDSWWSTFLHYQHGERDAVDRLIEWGWSDEDKKHISNESIRLCCTALVWFLATPNRFLRDKSTRALVALLKNRLSVVLTLLKQFSGVDDPYIQERLYAVAYGSVSHSRKDRRELKELAVWIYSTVFKTENPPVNVLIRDYARGLIEIAQQEKVQLKIIESRVRPPFKSKWPNRIASEKTLKRKYYPKEFFEDKTKDRGFLDIWSSIMHDLGPLDDFEKSIDHSISHWSGRKLDGNEVNRKVLLDEFKKDLNRQQRNLFGKATNPFFGIDLSKIVASIKTTSFKGEEFDLEKSEEYDRRQKIEMSKAYADFEKSLSLAKRKFFCSNIKPFLSDNGQVNDPLDRFDLKLAQRWMFSRVVELGYSPALHGEFDSSVSRHVSLDRSESKAERIGKKYQWIAYHEFIALLSDNFEFKGDSWSSDKKEDYLGPWNPHIRDIDPSLIIQNDNHLKAVESFSQWSSSAGKYDGWKSRKSDKNWMKTKEDIPKPGEVIKITGDSKKEWLVLDGFLDWQEDTPPENERYDVPSRSLWYKLKSYIVKKKDAKTFYNLVRNRRLMGRSMPESNAFHEVFLGEYPNSLAFVNLRGNYNIWTNAGIKEGDLPVKVVVPDDSYTKEFIMDGSHIGSVSVKLPCKWLVNKMKLKHTFLDGRFFDTKNNLVAIPTSIFEESFPSVLLIDKKALLDFLEKNECEIFWTILGEKQLIGGSHSREDYIGRLEINGVYSVDKKRNIVGRMRVKFVE